MKFSLHKFFSFLFLAGGVSVLMACNKDVDDAVPVVPAATSGQTIAELVNSDADYSLLRFAINRAGTSVSSLLGDRTGVFTFFAPNNAAFALSNFADTNAIKTQSAANWASILQYHIVGGQRITSSMIAESQVNVQLPSQLVLAQPSATLPPGLRASVFPSKRGTAFWANNVPLVQTDVSLANGILHKTAALLSPPASTLYGILAANPTKYSFFLTAVARADSGLAAAVGLGRLDSVLKYPPVNLTLFAPNNDAFRAMFPAGTPDANITAALNDWRFFPAQTLRGLVAYHLLGTRYFSVNLPAGTNMLPTQLNVPPVVPAIITYSGTTFTIKGVAATSPTATVVTRDINAVNGTIHEINQVIRPF